jgi:hypothetical protein
MVNSTDLAASSINLATALLGFPLAKKAVDEAQTLHDWLVGEGIQESTFSIMMLPKVVFDSFIFHVFTNQTLFGIS